MQNSIHSAMLKKTAQKYVPITPVIPNKEFLEIPCSEGEAFRYISYPNLRS